MSLEYFRALFTRFEQRTGDGFAVDVDRRNIARDIFFEGETVLFDLEAVRIQRGANEFGEIGFLELVFLAAGFDAGEIENIVDERGETFAFFANDAEVFLIFFFCGEAAELEGLRIETDQREGRAQFVRDIGDEIGFEAREVHFPGNIAIGEA